MTLLGDAAHPMLPHLAQGACMALEDAVTLGHAVGRTSDLPGALELYNRARHARTTRAVFAARQVSRLYHLEQADRVIRNQNWRQQTPEQFYEALDWLYGWKPERCLVVS